MKAVASSQTPVVPPRANTVRLRGHHKQHLHFYLTHPALASARCFVVARAGLLPWRPLPTSLRDGFHGGGRLGGWHRRHRSIPL